MSDKLRLIVLIAIVFVAVLAFLGWRTAVFCYSLDFPENFELVVSRCRDAEIIDVAPNGEHIVVWVEHPEKEYWLINNVTKERFILPEPHSIGYTFVTNDLMLYGFEGDFYLWSISSKQPQALQLLDINPEQDEGVKKLEAMEEIYYLELPNRVIAFDKEGPSTTRYIVINSQKPGGFFREIEGFLIKNDIMYVVLLPGFRACQGYYPPPLDGCVSHNDINKARGSFIYTKDGELIIKLRRSDFPHIPGTSFGFAGWTHDDSGLFIEFGHGYIIDNNGGWLIPDIGIIPGGVGILKLPEQ